MDKMQIAEDDVRCAYRLLFGREPDPSGFRHHVENARANGLTPVDLAGIFMRSTEFLQRRHARPAMDEVVLHDVRIFPWHGDTHIGGGLAASGEYEPHVLPRFLERLKPGDVVLDIGANIGTYSLTAASRVGPHGKVIAVEPLSRNVQSLCMGVHANGFTNVSILPVAASGVASVVGVFRHDDSSNGIVDAGVTGSIAADFVPTQRLDELLAHLTRLDVVKIDIEGHEPVAWQGLRALVERHRPTIFSEFSPAAIRNHSRVDPETYLEQLFSIAVAGVQVLRAGMPPVTCASPAEVMQAWREANARAATLDQQSGDVRGQSGKPGDAVHVDLVVESRIPS